MSSDWIFEGKLDIVYLYFTRIFNFVFHIGPNLGLGRRGTEPFRGPRPGCNEIFQLVTLILQSETAEGWGRGALIPHARHLWAPTCIKCPFRPEYPTIKEPWASVQLQPHGLRYNYNPTFQNLLLPQIALVSCSTKYVCGVSRYAPPQIISRPPGR